MLVPQAVIIEAVAGFCSEVEKLSELSKRAQISLRMVSMRSTA